MIPNAVAKGVWASISLIRKPYPLFHTAGATGSIVTVRWRTLRSSEKCIDGIDLQACEVIIRTKDQHEGDGGLEPPPGGSGFDDAQNARAASGNVARLCEM